MRLLSLMLVVGFAAAGCGLDPNGLGDDGGGALPEDGSPALDSTVFNDASGGSDGNVWADTAPTGDDGANGSDGSDGSTDTGSGDGGAHGDADAGVDTGVDSGVDAGPHDAGTDAADSADPPDSCGSVEICNNGIDDNCDGKIDCADPQCSPGWTCTAGSVPAGWSIVEYVGNQRPACQVGYGTFYDVVEGPAGGPATCGCGCVVTSQGSCESGNFSVKAGGGLLGGCGSPPVTSAAADGACSPATVNYTPPSGARLQVSPAGYTAGACTPAPTVSVPPVTYAGQGRVCQDTEGAGAGCPSGGACAPATSTGFHLCILHDGVQACPPGYAKSHAIAGGITDTRGCTTCTCGGAGATCANASLTLFTKSNCDVAGAAVVPADDKCNAVPGLTGGGAPTYVAYQYTAQVQGEGCPPSPVAPSGGISETQPRTVCCQ